MAIKKYLFLSTEGNTFQPGSESIEPDIENLQVIGFAKGNDAGTAFKQLIKKNSYLRQTSFDEIFSYELSKDYLKTKSYHFLSSIK